jgi:hypothetical protein
MRAKMTSVIGQVSVRGVPIKSSLRVASPQVDRGSTTLRGRKLSGVSVHEPWRIAPQLCDLGSQPRKPKRN